MSAFAWLLAIGLLIEGWEGSPWPLRAVELLAVAVVVAALAYRKRRLRRPAAGTRPSAVYVPPPDGFAACAAGPEIAAALQDIAEKAKANAERQG